MAKVWCLDVSRLKSAVETQQQPGIRHVQLCVYQGCPGELYQAFARQHPELQSLSIDVFYDVHHEWHTMIALLPGLTTLSIDISFDSLRDRNVQAILPRVTELRIYGETKPVIDDDVAAALRSAHRLQMLGISVLYAPYVLGIVPSSVRQLILGHNFTDQPLPPSVDAAIQCYLRRADPPLDHIRLDCDVWPALLNAVLELCTGATMCIQTATVLDAIRARPGRKLRCRSLHACHLNNSKLWMAPTDHQDRVAALAESALPVAHLPELTALFLL
jgi:hypothetical protein